MFELMESSHQDNNAVIKVVGVGGGGGNAVEHMVAENIDGVEFICANTDAQALKGSNAKIHIQLGDELTKGLGAGANPQIGREAAEEDRDHIREILSGADMVFITAGMGGGTGTGAAPVFAEIAKELGILTVAVVTKPFSFEGKQRALAAEDGIRRLAEHVDSLITIPNNKLLSVLGKNISLLNAFKAANNVLLGAVKGISDLITRPGLINVDFADVRTVMSEMGMAMMGTGSAVGEQRARQAAEAAIASPLLEDVNFSGARGILVNITAGLDMSIGEFEEVGDVVKEFISDDATVVVGTVIDPEMTDEMRVTVIVTGLGDMRQRHQQPQQQGQRARLMESTRSDGSLDYHQLDRPAVIRKQAQSAAVSTSSAKQKSSVSDSVPDVDYLDIPAFLRRQEEEA
ncbi:MULTISPECIES: cell division protein FtsZ [Legionella]|uniref:Cell division protein FtsZ n=2 Tax=Legionella TaxID=445 RepID=A0A378KQB2_9GAMM|nr:MULTISPECIES: cell division protein FtsZ [Legionella]KTD44699.1 cell division protein FtsZ [Legionella quateirensis]MBL7480534.1 cell division protein FtsZ [Legionella bononiensis]MBL7526227.1 cell division protein FtsZ [Legionella bononiensis]MBL7563278.1 cell division protein FtsZ [Legionella bononiensis]STY16783.1 cell division protein FtsZ [Legionella quateirensis]